MKLTRTPIASAVAVVLMGVMASSHAQQTAAPAEMNAVTVTGIRASLQTAVNVKRNATSIVDAVSAEDVGKLPDSDVGEAMGRIPGVAVGRAFGQGASVSIRGSDPQMTYTTLNGQTIASTGWYDQQAVDRSFNYSLLPSVFIGGMEVYKSSQADLTEGGIGGTVIVKTRKPLDLPSGQAFVGAKVGKGTVSTDLTKEVSGLYSWKNNEKTFGVLVAAAREQGDYRRLGNETLAGWGGSMSANAFVQERQRDAFNLTLQARPATGVELGLTQTNFKLKGDNSNSSLFIFQADSCTNVSPLDANLCLASNTAAPGKKAAAPYFQTFARIGTMTSDSTVLNGSYKTDGFKIEGVLGTTKADGGTSFTANYGASAAPWNGSINSMGKRIELSPVNANVTGLPSQYDSGGGSWAIVRQPNSDKENFAQADVSVDLDWGVIQSFKTGVRVAKHTFTKQADRPTLKAFGTVPFGAIYGGAEPLGFEMNAPRANLGAMVTDATQYITGWVMDRSAYGELNEDNKAAYGMFNFEKGALRGNFGLRYIGTDISASGYQFDSTVANQSISQNNGWSTGLMTKTANYNDVLPSVNVAWDLNKNTILRLAAAQAITRPNYGDMFLGGSVQGFNDTIAGNEAVTIGNPALKPQKSAQFDLGVEYYYGKGNLIAVTYFHKDVDNFITAQTQRNQKIGLVSPDSKLDNWTVNTVTNAGGGKIDGLEFQINHGFDNGFGVAANYTYADATAPSASYADELNLFTASSRNTANLVGYWENAVYSARLAYNWRSEYMIRETGFYSNRKHDAFGTLDLSLGWNITKDLKLAFEALNLLKADDIQYGAAAPNNTKLAAELRAGYPAWSFKGETTYRASLTAKF